MAEINPSELFTKVYKAIHPLSHMNLHLLRQFSACGARGNINPIYVDILQREKTYHKKQNVQSKPLLGETEWNRLKIVSSVERANDINFFSVENTN